MYLNYYGLKKAPFHITPDPEFLFLSPSHKAALGALIYGIEERQGFVALVGEVGLGKTTILRSYLDRVDRNQLKTIYIFNANVTFGDLLKTIYREVGREMETEDLYEAVNQLHQILVEEYQRDRNVALIVDEAQHMPVETLENLRMLSNLETSTQKLIQVVLVGQPELEAKLMLHELRQLHQRIVIRATIEPLTYEESLAYVQHRIDKVAIGERQLFAKGALQAIIKEARGTPRVLNILCTNALISGFGHQVPRVTAKIAKEVIAAHASQSKPLPTFSWKPWLMLPVGAALLAALVWFSLLSPTVSAKLFPDLVGLPTLFSRPDDVVSHPASSGIASPQVKPAGTPPPPQSESSALPSVQEPAPPVVPELPRTVALERRQESPEVPQPFAIMRTIKQGDRLSKLAAEIYGVATPEVYEWIKQHNTHVQNIHRLEVGTTITFPPRSFTP
jgi:general secretion pathway protein A